ncbi:MAG: hypothetical protein LIO90_00010 [Bacteroidales bacterium]|nr:hypothetical protein [Bacteroidales bacterium]
MYLHCGYKVTNKIREIEIRGKENQRDREIEDRAAQRGQRTEDRAAQRGQRTERIERAALPDWDAALNCFLAFLAFQLLRPSTLS